MDTTNIKTSNVAKLNEEKPRNEQQFKTDELLVNSAQNQSQDTSDTEEEQEEEINVAELIKYIEKFNGDNPKLRFFQRSEQLLYDRYNTITYFNFSLNFAFSYVALPEHKQMNLQIYKLGSKFLLHCKSIEEFDGLVQQRVQWKAIENQMIDYLTKELEGEYQFAKKSTEFKDEDTYINKKLQLSFSRDPFIYHWFIINPYIDIKDSNKIEKYTFDYVIVKPENNGLDNLKNIIEKRKKRN